MGPFCVRRRCLSRTLGCSHCFGWPAGGSQRLLSARCVRRSGGASGVNREHVLDLLSEEFMRHSSRQSGALSSSATRSQQDTTMSPTVGVCSESRLKLTWDTRVRHGLCCVSLVQLLMAAVGLSCFVSQGACCRRTCFLVPRRRREGSLLPLNIVYIMRVCVHVCVRGGAFTYLHTACVPVSLPERSSVHRRRPCSPSPSVLASLILTVDTLVTYPFQFLTTFFP